MFHSSLALSVYILNKSLLTILHTKFELFIKIHGANELHNL
jgi:hypothetical protein